MNSQSLAQLDVSFAWFIGVVVDRNDPLRLGRARVRVYGKHSMDPDILPTEQLPWAIPLTPLANPDGAKSPPDGTFVFGFYADGPLAQQPIMIGALPGFRYRETQQL